MSLRHPVDPCVSYLLLPSVLVEASKRERDKKRETMCVFVCACGRQGESGRERVEWREWVGVCERRRK